jgi:hypothetical protein
MFTIETNIPVAPAAPRGRKPAQFPLRSMAVGDSFIIAIDGEGKQITKTAESWRRKLRIAFKLFAGNNEAKFQMATTKEGLRVWRVA